MGVDARKSLSALHEQWDDCEKCDLGERRAALGAPVLHGRGARRGIFAVIGSPCWKDEANGIGTTDGAELLLGLLEKQGVMHQTYLTYAVSCRSCRPSIDNTTGAVRMRRMGKHMVPMFSDVPPTGDQVKACAERLYEELYIVDPLIVLACGESAVNALAGRAMNLNNVRGTPQHFTIPGVGAVPKLTEKKGAWLREAKGVRSFPTKPFGVRYLMFPTHDPDYVLKNAADTRLGSPGLQFAEDIAATAHILNRLSADSPRIEPEPEPEPVEEDEDYND